ncbi:hypothetical protein ACA910_011990 [Epithemia clementina (nom. ined.)]
MVQVLAVDLEFTKFKATIPGTVHAEMQNAFQDNHYTPTSLFQRHLAQWTIGFLKDWSSSPSSPGDKLLLMANNTEMHLWRLEQDVLQLNNAGTSMHGNQTLALAGSTTMMPHFGWGVTSTTTSGNLNPLPVMQQGLTSSSMGHGTAGVTPGFEMEIQEKLQGLNEALDAIQDQLEAESVEIARKLLSPNQIVQPG